ncbi:hypothetical protein [Amycolatopsis sp. NPDC098790]|uniref:hypothetical protein n=1 Tax=Amycolatopsis sp. NPDC098790 TaxID=3363939 RepID=UPI00382A0290
MTTVAAPYWVSELRDLVVALQRGRWAIARWEDLGPDEDLAHWQAAVREACTTDIDPLFLDIPRRSLTIVLNAAVPAPDDEQIHLSIAAVEASRFTGHPIRLKYDLDQ